MNELQRLILLVVAQKFAPKTNISNVQLHILLLFRGNRESGIGIYVWTYCTCTKLKESI